MSSFIIYYRTAWNDFFSGTTPATPLVPKQYTSRQTVSGNYIHVTNCLFNQITSSSNGGALYCSSATYLLVESSYFYSCKTTSTHGGAIYFSYSSGECVLHRVCGYSCFSTNIDSTTYGQFAYISVNNVASSKNYVNYSSITRSVGELTTVWHPLDLNNGKILCPSINSSMNKCGYRTGASCYPFLDSNSVTCQLTYSTFADNNSTGHRCIYFSRSGANYEIKYCNVIRNTQISSSQGTIDVTGNTTITESCILENNATNVFSASTNCIITLLNCTVDRTTSTGTLKIQKTATKSFIHALNHISTGNCIPVYDSVRTLTPITQYHSCNIIVYYNTCKRFNCQPHMSDFISLMWVFMFHAIHPFPSVIS
jgi:hypothetical protein